MAWKRSRAAVGSYKERRGGPRDVTQGPNPMQNLQFLAFTFNSSDGGALSHDRISDSRNEVTYESMHTMLLYVSTEKIHRHL